MPSGLFNRLKTWVGLEIPSYSDLNAEINNIIANLYPTKIDDHSDNVSQMQQTFDPGSVGSENQPESLGEEIESVRFKLKQIIGGAQWYSTPSISLAESATLLQSAGTVRNRIVSGAKLATNVPSYLQADSVNKSLELKAASTNLVFYVAGTQYTATADEEVTGLSTAPGSNNTCLINDSSLAGGQSTKWAGVLSALTIDNAGSEITSLVGRWACFKLVNDATSVEYILAYIASSTELRHVRRGFFFDDAATEFGPIVCQDNNVLTLMKLTWVFIETDGDLVVTYNPPSFGTSSPSSPSPGDFWFDTANDVWKTYSGGSWAASGATFCGLCAQDSTGTIAARPADFFAVFSDDNSVDVFEYSNAEIRSKDYDAKISVMGVERTYFGKQLSWAMPGSLRTGVEASSTRYFLYVTDQGDLKFDVEHPNDQRGDRKGWYHPWLPWRCVGYVDNDSSSDFGTPAAFSNLYGLIQTTDLQDEVVTFAKLARRTAATTVGTGGVTLGSSSGSFTNAGTSEEDVTNLTRTVTISGRRPVLIAVQGIGDGASPSRINGAAGSTTSIGLDVKIYRGATVIYQTRITLAGASGNLELSLPSNIIWHIDNTDLAVAAGSYTYKVAIDTSGLGAGALAFAHSKLLVLELA